MSDGPSRLAVYGTLAPGGSNHHVLADVAGTWTSGMIVGTRHDDGWHGYPGVVLGGTGTVAVDVLHAPELAHHLPRLDDFEGPGYERTVATAHLDEGPDVEVWVYVLRDLR